MISDFHRKVINVGLVNPEIPNGDEYNAWRLRNITLEEFKALSNNSRELSYDQLAYIAYWGILAPSSHNTVPVRLKLKPEASFLSIYIDRKYILPYSDINGRQAIISVGCAWANIELAAAHFGYKIDSKFTTGLESKIQHTQNEDQRYCHLADLHLREGAVEIIPNSLSSMLKRKVVRAEYDDAFKIDDAVLSIVISHVEKRFPAVELKVITDRKELHTLAKFQEDADRTVFENDDFTHELGNWLHSNVRKMVAVGMKGKEFGFDDSFSKKMHKGLLREERLTADQIAGFARGGRVAIDSSSALLVFSIQKDIPYDQLMVGRAYQEVAILLQANNIYHSIHAGITEVNWINKIVATTVLNTKNRPSVIIRIGVPKREEDKYRPHSGRPDLSSVLL